jgi:DNA-binding transcriptional LysR family regulator
MTEELLRFKRVVEAGSISKASRLLFVSQPALSKSIRLLEEKYGVALLERRPSGVRPTAFGRIVYQGSCEVERSLLRIDEELLAERAAREPGAARKEINIGCSAIWNDVLLPEVMKSIETIDDYEIHVSNDTSEQLLSDLLHAKRFDFVLCRILEDDRYKPLSLLPLCESRTAVFLSEDHPASQYEVSPGQLRELRWIKLKSLPLPGENDLTPAGLTFFDQGFFSSAITFEVEDLMAAIQLLRTNHAILLPLAFAGILQEYGIRPVPFERPLTNTYWLGMAHPRENAAGIHVEDLMTRIRLFFSVPARRE